MTIPVARFRPQLCCGVVPVFVVSGIEPVEAFRSAPSFFLW